MLTFIPEEIVRYCAAHTSPESPLYQKLAAETEEKTDMPQMQVGHVEGVFLKVLTRSLGARRALEIGTFTGYSTLMIAEGLAGGGEVITCDIDRRAANIAQKYWNQSPHGKKITFKFGRALDTLETIEGPIDFVFIDADKTNYIRYWDACVPKVRTGGIIVADNVLWSGRVLDPKEPDDRALAAFNEHARRDDRVDLVMLPVRDGLSIACRR